MPVSSKPDKVTPVGVEEPLKQAIGLIEKKVRNLEKRKSKLDDIRARKAKGTQLEKDQEEAIANYDVVDKNLGFAREMITTFTQLETEIDKLARKQAKRERLERQAAEAARCKALLVLQSTLDGMGAEEVRDHFINGTHGAIKVTEENLDQLDGLYKLVNPSRDTENSFEDELKSAADHMACYLEPRDKEVLGTNYKDLRTLVESIHESGYFDKKQEVENGEAEEEVVEEEEIPAPDTTEAAFEAESEMPVAPVAVVAEEPIQVQEITESQVHEEPASMPPAAAEATPAGAYNEADASYYSTAPYQRRDFQEIVSSVKGTYSFLQDSHIDEHDSLHMDPAVLAAQPIRTNLTATDSQQPPAAAAAAAGQSQSIYQNSAYMTTESDKSHTQDSYHHQTQQQSYTQQSFDPPAAIPMPNQTPLNTEQEKKPAGVGFTMNANAAIFQPSMFDAAGQSTPAGGAPAAGHATQPPQSTPEVSAHPTESAEVVPPVHEHEALDAAAESQEYEKQEEEFQGWGNFRRGGGRGRGRGMSNGYRGGRGGAQNGGYRDNRDQSGGQRPYNNQRGGYRGGNNQGYQGYPPRQDYKPDGYQGYSNGESRGYNNQRGGGRGGKPQGGAPRDGGYNGGRGGPRGGRGGNRQPYNNQGQQQQAAAM